MISAHRELQRSKALATGMPDAHVQSFPGKSAEHRAEPEAEVSGALMCRAREVRAAEWTRAVACAQAHAALSLVESSGTFSNWMEAAVLRLAFPIGAVITLEDPGLSATSFMWALVFFFFPVRLTHIISHFKKHLVRHRQH